MRLRRPVRFASALAASALVLAGCTGMPGGSSSSTSTSASSSASTAGATGSSTATATESGGQLPEIQRSSAQDLSGDPASDSAYAAYYGQKVEWSECGDYPGAQCGTVTVPKAWNDPGKGEVTLALLKVPATGSSKGSLFLNPGGPGGSGVSFVGQNGRETVSADVRKDYDLIGFDPRGVAESDPIRCLSDPETDQYLSSTYNLLTADGVQQATQWATKVSDACKQNSGDMLGYMDTLSGARDMDVMRAAVGEKTLNYLGFSYGTYLGSTYADLYPSRVGRFVLDGAIDPTLNGDQMAAAQADGFEGSIHHFATWCLQQGSQTCPLTGTEDQAVQQVRDFLTATDATPVQTRDANRPLTGALARTAMLSGMYSDQLWPTVAKALKAAMNGDGAQLMSLADQGTDRGKDGHYAGNSNYTISAVNCLDHPSVEDGAWMKSEAQRMADKDPTFGVMLSYSGLTCSKWPAGPMRKPAEIHAKGSGPIVVVGTTNDPATPYAWAQSLSKQLDNGHLITWKGEGHTAYGRSGGCIEKAVDQFVLQGSVPQDGLTCD